MRKRDIQTSKNQNKIYKEQLDLLSQKAKNNSTQKISEIELKIDTLKQDNIAITKKIRDMKTKHNTKKKVLETNDNEFIGKVIEDVKLYYGVKSNKDLNKIIEGGESND